MRTLFVGVQRKPNGVSVERDRGKKLTPTQLVENEWDTVTLWFCTKSKGKKKGHKNDTVSGDIKMSLRFQGGGGTT